MVGTSRDRTAMTTPRQPLYITMHPQDNVAIVANDGGLPAGTVFASGLTLTGHVPQGHKVALEHIPQNAPVRRYNVTIGYALQDLPAGSWVNEKLLRMPDARELDNLPISTAPRALAHHQTAAASTSSPAASTRRPAASGDTPTRSTPLASTSTKGG